MQLTKADSVTIFDCGCTWLWNVGKPHPNNFSWAKQCKPHGSQPRATDSFGRECVCLSVGQDDGAKTCWMHHDCRDGSCTHMDEV